MKKYLVNVEEVLTRNVIIEAEDELDAEWRVERLYFKSKIVLISDHFVGEPTIKCLRVCDDTEECTELD